MNHTAVLICFLFFGWSLCRTVNAQTSGKILDAETSEPLEGAVVRVRGTLTGAVSDETGRFSLSELKTYPQTLVVTYIGYDSSVVTLTQAQNDLIIRLKPAGVNLQTVEIESYRISQKEKESPQTIEKLDLIAIKETPAVNFYDGLANLKGVDITAAAMGFKIINTRGFNSTQPVRSLQIIDGADNQAPGLNFALGNMVGSSELDVQSVEIVVGAGTALYGPGAFNGVINMTGKSPFLHKGVSVMLKGGERSLFDGALRYAEAFQTKAGRDVFAFKINLAYMRAYDWEAGNLTPTEQSELQVPNGINNPGGYDAINRYGDENRNQSINNFNDPRNRRLSPGLGVIFRTGYREPDIADYNTYSAKFNTALHYKPTEKSELIYNYRFGMGTTVFQGINRISLRDLIFQQHQLEFKNQNLMLRAYATVEDAGSSFDIVRTAAVLQREQKGDRQWSDEYYAYWSRNIDPKIKSMEGYRSLPAFTPQTLTEYYRALDAFIGSIGDSLNGWHRQTRSAIDGPNFLKPGTPEFKKRVKEITSNSATASGGTRFTDFSALYHLQGEYKLPVDKIEIRTGGNFRLYRPNSEGTIFTDTLRPDGSRNVISVWEAGLFAYGSKKVWKDRLKLTGAVRGDVHQNYSDPIFSPSVSAVYSPKIKDKEHFFRFSYNYAFRFPTLQDQYLNYNVDGIILRGNLTGLNNIISIQSLYDYFGSGNEAFLQSVSVPGVKPERVQTAEIGYKGMLFKNFFVDASYYHSWYRDFIGFRFVSTSPLVNGQPKDITLYRLSTNAPGTVRTQGFSFGANYYFKKYYTLSGNYSWNRLEGNLPDRQARDPFAPFVPAFNTPEHKFNIGFAGTQIRGRIGSLEIKNVGFNVNFRWTDGFYFEGSPQYTGFVRAYHVTDAQINYTYTVAKTKKRPLPITFKLGASNLFNRRFIQVYGGPEIGRMAYFALQAEWK